MKPFQIVRGLFGLALIFLGFSLGWVAGLRRGGSLAPETLQPAWILLGASIVCALAVGLIVWGLRAKPRPAGNERSRILDLAEIYRDARRAGPRPPLFTDAARESRLVVPLPIENLAAETECEFVVEHWQGAPLRVTCGGESWTLRPQQLLRLRVGAGQKLEIRDTGTDLKADAPYVLVHRRSLENENT